MTRFWFRALRPRRPMARVRLLAERLDARIAPAATTIVGGQSFYAGQDPSSVAVADVNGDQRPDALVANYADGTVSVLLGNGDGSFQTQQVFSAGTGAKPLYVLTADVNGDTRPDLITGNAGSGSVG